MQNQFWRLPQVLAATGLSRPVLYRLMAAGEFPANFALTERSRAWNSAEVQEWMTKRVAAGRKAA